MAVSDKVLVIGGLRVYIHGFTTLQPGKPITVLFLLHGRLGAHTDFGNGGTLSEHRFFEKNTRPDLKQQLYRTPSSFSDDRLVCTFDQRNHGDRQVDQRAKYITPSAVTNP